MKKISVVLFFLITLICQTTHGQESFPFLAEINAKNVNVRAGQSENFEKLTTLNKGDKVVVLGRSYSWYKIRLPADARCYMHSKYIDMLSNDIGSVSGNRVNVRAGPDSMRAILGQLKRGTKVRVVSQVNDWLEIDPVEGIYGWVLYEYVTFVSRQIPPPTVVSLPTRNIYVQKRILEAQAKAKTKVKAETESEAKVEAKSQVRHPQPPANPIPSSQPPTEKPIAVIGDLSKINGETRGHNYQLIVDGTTVYYLEGPASILAAFAGNKVRVTGTTFGNSAQGSAVINVKRIQFVL